MIQRLSIEGLAIIEELSIEFSPGFNVITGETGAGKSILIRALNYLTGGKASPDSIRSGETQAVVTGQFVVPNNHDAALLLGNLGIPVEEGLGGTNILIRRQLTTKGRSQAWVNDTMITNHTLKELGASLLDVFAQHENQRLLDSNSHTKYLDNFLKERTTFATLVTENEACLAIVRELKERTESFGERHKNHDYLLFRIEALKKFEPSAEDFEQIRSLCERAETQVKLREGLSLALQRLSHTEEGVISETLFSVSKELGRLSEYPDVTPLKEKAEELARAIEDLHYQLERKTNDLEIDDEALESAQSRIFGYQDLFRKHGVSDAKALRTEMDRLTFELSFLEDASSQIENKLIELKEHLVRLQEAASQLSRARKQAAQGLKKRVESELRELAMAGSKFEVNLCDYSRPLAPLNLSDFSDSCQRLWQELSPKLASLGERGAETAEFFLSTNPGEPVLALQKVVSGGELSRIMLAFKRALAADASTCVLVFDEIDSGISGRVADVVGQKLQDLSEQFQVLCISHLPQVAVYADSHFLVRKEGKGSRTQTGIVRLTGEQSAKEIARLLSSDEVSHPSLANAKNLIAKAQAKARARDQTKAEDNKRTKENMGFNAR